MTLKIAYIPHSREDKDGARWGENTVMRNLIVNSSGDFEIIPEYDAWECLDSNYDLICLHNLSHTAMRRRRWIRGGARLEQLLKRPISAFHTSDIGELYDLPNRPVLMGGIRGYNGLQKARGILKCFDAIHVNNNHLRNEVLKHGARNAYVLYPGVDMELFKPMPELRPDTFTVGWSGDASKPTKNADLIHSLGYRSKIASKEYFIPHDEMPKFYNSLNVYVHFSSHEGWGMGVIEAMACGLPVVSSSAGSGSLLSPDWIVNGDPREDGWILDFWHRVERLRKNKELRKEVGHRNREHVKPWAWPNLTRKFEKVCTALIYGDIR